MADISQSREDTQPIRTRTGGSTFTNPPGRKAWELIDAAGCRGLAVGEAELGHFGRPLQLIDRSVAISGQLEVSPEARCDHARIGRMPPLQSLTDRPELAGPSDHG